MKLKICGMKYHDNIEVVAELKPDYLGFIFYEKSSRYFDGEIPKLPKSIKKTGVFVDAPESVIIENVMQHNLDAIQLHGSESPEYCRSIQTMQFGNADDDGNYTSHDFEVIKVFSMKNNFNFSNLEPYETVCDYYLFDTKGKLPGGNGFIFNWDVLKNYPSKKPYFLSGGIGLDEIEDISEFLKKPESKYCYAIDVNSKFEIEPGLKDIKLLEKFKIA